MLLTWLQFFTTPQGQTTLTWEKEAYAHAICNITGDRAVQLGNYMLDALKSSDIGHQILVVPQACRLSKDDWRVALVADPQALPLQTECTDLIVWPHGADDPTVHSDKVLSEIYRVLAPGGVLVMTFFNASGFWYLKNRFSKNPFLPQNCTPQRVADVKAKVSASGLSVEGGFFGVYGVSNTPKNGASLLPSKLDLAGNRWWPTLSNVVLLTARKKVTGMTLVGRAAFSSTTVPASARTAVQRKEAADFL